jgi:predicted dehydrogenase
MKRRNFLMQSSILAGGLLLHEPLSSLPKMYSGDKITIGLIGCGGRGKGIMEDVLNVMTDKFTITAICDILDFRLKEADQITPGIKHYKDYRKLLDDKNVQAVIIATPLYLHYQMASDALKAGKHIYLEKTMTYSIDEAISLVKEAEQHPGQVLQIGHQLPYTPLYRKAKEMIEKGYLGKVTQIDCRYDRHGDWRKPVPDPSLEKSINWRMYKAFSGGLTAEILAHQIEFINWAFNTHPDELFSTGGIDYYKDGRETYDNVQVMLRYNKAEMIGNFGATCANARDGFIFKIKGSKGTLELLFEDGLYFPEPETKKQLETVDGVAGATKIEWKKGGGIAIMDEHMKEGTWYAFEDFYKCIKEKKRPVSDVIAGATSAVCVALSNESLYNHAVQHWEPAYDFKSLLSD